MLGLVRSMVHGFRATRQGWAVREALAPLQVNGTLTRDEMRALRKAFSNEGFSADVDYLLAVQSALTAGPVLECGTGATTLLCQTLGRRFNFRTYSLEQDSEWSAYVRRFLGPETAISILDAPLKDNGGYLWYDAPADLPHHFSLIICDGPAIYDVPQPLFLAWRYGILPWLKETGRTYDVLLLDDTNEPRGGALLTRWQDEFGVSVEIVQAGEGSYAIIRPGA